MTSTLRSKGYPFFVFYLIYWLAYASLFPYLGVYYESIGLVGTQIGFLGSITAFVEILSSILISIIADIIKKPKLILIVLLLGLIFAAFLLKATTVFSIIVISVIILGFCTSPINTLVDKMLLDTLESKESYGLYRLGGSIGYGLGIYLIGYSILNYGLNIIFPKFIIIILINIIVFLALSQSIKNENFVEDSKTINYKDIKDNIKNKNLVVIYGTLLLWGITESSFGQFLSLHLLSNGFSSISIGFIIAAALLGEIFCFMLTPYLLNKIKLKKIILLSFLLQFVRAFTLSRVPPFKLLIVGQFIGGGSFPLIWASTTQLIDNYFIEDIGNTMQGLKNVMNNGIGRIIGYALSGFLYQEYNSSAIFKLMAAISLAFLFVNLFINFIDRRYSSDAV